MYQADADPRQCSQTAALASFPVLNGPFRARAVDVCCKWPLATRVYSFHVSSNRGQKPRPLKRLLPET